MYVILRPFEGASVSQQNHVLRATLQMMEQFDDLRWELANCSLIISSDMTGK
jgi:hypothetical protein